MYHCWKIGSFTFAGELKFIKLCLKLLPDCCPKKPLLINLNQVHSEDVVWLTLRALLLRHWNACHLYKWGAQWKDLHCTGTVWQLCIFRGRKWTAHSNMAKVGHSLGCEPVLTALSQRSEPSPSWCGEDTSTHCTKHPQVPVGQPPYGRFKSSTKPKTFRKETERLSGNTSKSIKV